MSEKPLLGPRKSLDICEYLFQTLQLETRKLISTERVLLERLLIERYGMSKSLATDLLNFLRRT